MHKDRLLPKEPDYKIFRKLSVEQQIEWIVQHMTQDLYWVIRPIVKTHEDTNDVLQNVLIKAYKNLYKFKYQSKLFSWLYRIAVNEAFNHIKKMAKYKNLNLEDYMLQSLKYDAFYNGDEIAIILEKAVLKLPPKQQEVFRLKYFNAMTFEEMSDILDTSVGALKSSYHLAVKKIKDFLKEY